MQILFSSLHNLDLAQDDPVKKDIPDDFKPFIERYINYACNENKTFRLYIVSDINRTVVNCISKLCWESVKSTGNESVEKAQQSFTDSIASKLQDVERNVQERIQHMTSVQKGSIIQALILNTEAEFSKEALLTGNTPTYFRYIVAKVEHEGYFNSETLKKSLGFPSENNQVWKSTIFDITFDENHEPTFSDVRVYVNNKAKYWADEFLELKAKQTDVENTKAAFHAVDKVFLPLKHESPQDYYNLRNSLVHKLQSDKDISFPDMVEDLVGSYVPASDNVNTAEIKDKLTEAGKSGKFDTQFHADPSALKKDFKMTFHVAPSVDLVIKEGLPNWKEQINTIRKSDGSKYIMIKCDDENVLRNFHEVDE